MYTHSYDETKETILILNIKKTCKLLEIHYDKDDLEHMYFEIARKVGDAIENYKN